MTLFMHTVTIHVYDIVYVYGYYSLIYACGAIHMCSTFAGTITIHVYNTIY